MGKPILVNSRSGFIGNSAPIQQKKKVLNCLQNLTDYEQSVFVALAKRNLKFANNLAYQLEAQGRSFSDFVKEMESQQDKILELSTVPCEPLWPDLQQQQPKISFSASAVPIPDFTDNQNFTPMTDKLWPDLP